MFAELRAVSLPNLQRPQAAAVIDRLAVIPRAHHQETLSSSASFGLIAL